jgi:hypothetical protein
MSWSARVTARAGVSLLPSVSTPQSSPRINSSHLVAQTIESLRAAVDELVEPAISFVRAREEHEASTEDCFSSDAGRHLRFRCCVYFSTLAGALLEWRFGVHREHHGGWSAAARALTLRAPTPYGALARWLLRPPPLATPHAVARAERLMAEAGAHDTTYSLSDLRRAAGQLEGPLGQYVARLLVGGARGTLWRCEVTTAHTYLVFEFDHAARAGKRPADIYIDVSYKQFLLLPELMDERHFAAARSGGLFRDEPEAFVGGAAALGTKMTLANLQAAFRTLDDAVGAAGAERLATKPELSELVTLRNEGIFALRDRQRRKALCGRPWQDPQTQQAAGR